MGRVINGRKGRQRERERTAGAEETLEMTACKYANRGPLKWRWRGGRIKSSEHCVIMDQFAAIKPPYGWSLWNGEISAPQGQLQWQWRSQATGVTREGPIRGQQHQRDGRKADDVCKTSAFKSELYSFLILMWVVGHHWTKSWLIALRSLGVAKAFSNGHIMTTMLLMMTTPHSIQYTNPEMLQKWSHGDTFTAPTMWQCKAQYNKMGL